MALVDPKARVKAEKFANRNDAFRTWIVSYMIIISPSLNMDLLPRICPLQAIAFRRSVARTFCYTSVAMVS